MQAIGYYQYGDPDVLEVIDLPDPRPGEGQVRIRVHAAAVNPTDTMRRAGLRRSEGRPMPHVPGMDVAGVLAEIGPRTVTDLQVGDRVMALVVPDGSHGGYAEQVVVPAASVVAAPRESSFAESSTLLMNSLTARVALGTLGLGSSGVIAVTGAAGAMGGFAVQLAKADGLTVIADAAKNDEARVAGMGADLVLPRGEGFADRVRDRFPDGVDGAIDGSVQLDAVAPAVRDNGSVVTIRGYEKRGERGVTFRPVWVWDHALEQGILDTLRQQADDGILSMRVAEILPKEQAAQAHRLLEAGGVRGRLVLEF